MHVILHVGPPKTGSTALQTVLSEHSNSLADNGVLYFSGQFGDPGRTLSTLYDDADHLPPMLARHFKTRRKAREWSLWNWKNLEQTLRDTAPDYVILSSEHFTKLSANDPFKKRILDTFDQVTVVGYPRDPVSLFVSGLGQRMRGTLRLRQMYGPNEPYYSLTESLRGFEQWGPNCSMRLRHMHRDNLVNSDVSADFIDVVEKIVGRKLGLPETSAPKTANSGLSGAAAAWLLLMNEVDRPIGDPKHEHPRLERRQTILRKLANSSELAKLPSMKLKDDVIASHVRKMAASTVAWINAGYMQGQIPLAASPIDETSVSKTELRERTRDWLMGYLTPEAMSLIATEIAVAES